MILDIESELTQYSNLVNGLTDISNSIGTIAAIFGVGIIIIIPIIFYLKYRMEIKIVRKGTLQALHEFYDKVPETKEIIVNTSTNEVNKEEIL